MKTLTRVLGASALMLLASNEAYSQAAAPSPPFAGFVNEYLREKDTNLIKWDFGGTIRARFEAKENIAIAGVPGSVDFKASGADTSNEYFLERIRYHAGYAAPWWGMYVEGQSSLAQRDERFAAIAPAPIPKKGDGPESDLILLRQAYLKAGNPSEFPLSLKVGRQELAYGEERLIGTVSWNNIGRVFDAAKVRWQNAWFGADVFTSRVVIPEDGRFNVSNDDDIFSGFYATTTKIPKHSLDFYFLSRNANTDAIAAEPSAQAPLPSARDIYTLGARLKSTPGQFGPWDYTAELMGQFGHFNDTRAGVLYKSQDHEAYAVILQGGYTFKETFGTPRVGLEYAHGSGDSNPNDKKHTTFENLFPTNHKIYGIMDFVSLQNIHDLHAFFQLKPHPRVTLSLEEHNYWLASPSDNFYNVQGAPRGGGGTSAVGYGVNPTYGSYVGSELDLIAGYRLARFAQLEAGYGHFFVGDYIAASLQKGGGAADADYCYMQVNITF